MSMSCPHTNLLAAGLAAALVSGQSLASGPALQSTAGILECAESYLTAAAGQHTGRVEVKLGHLDPRLRLSRCDQRLEAFQPSGARLSGATRVGIRCPAATGWTVYVHAVINVFSHALVTSRALAKGAALQPSDVQLTETEVSKLGQGQLQSLEEIQGVVLRRPVPAGTVLTPALVVSPNVIRRGTRVTLVNGQGPIQVEMLGEAVTDAARGQRVRVRALNSGKIIEGWAESASVVKVTL